MKSIVLKAKEGPAGSLVHSKALAELSSMTGNALANTAHLAFGEAPDMSLEIKTQVRMMSLPSAISTLPWIYC